MRIWGTLDAFFEPGATLGRIVANQGFLRALLRRAPFDAYHFFLEDRAKLDVLAGSLMREFPAMAGAGAFTLRDCTSLPTELAARPYHCFHLADCVMFPAHLVRVRNLLAPELFPITGVTHTLSHARDPARYLAQLWSGTTPRDAIVATSSAGAEVVRRMFAVLRERYELSEAFVAPQIEHVPLGIDVDGFPQPTVEERAAVRRALGAGGDDVVLLVFARISHVSKMDLLPLFAALERVFRDGVDPSRVLVVVAGALAEDDPQPALLQLVAELGGARLRIAANPDDAARLALYGAADVFLSPIDNVQETFGLTVLEAGAMGLPAIVSDYDGYRDLVLDDDTGLRIPTLGPAITTETDAVANLWFDSQYHLRLAQQTVVDVPALARALAALITSPGRRRAMGARAREHVRATYAWPRVIEAYLALWERLRAAPVEREALRSRLHPLHLPYAEVFGGYPTARLSGATTVRATARAAAVIAGLASPIVYGSLEPLLPDGLLREVFARARAPIAVAELLAWLERDRHRSGEAAATVILWSLKHDYLESAPSTST